MKKSILTQRLSKTYPARKKGESDFYAVQDLNLVIDQGEVVAFLGPNGAGKSTTIKMLSGILTPTHGTATIMGHPAGSRDANRLLGLVFGTRSQLFLHMTVAQSLDLISEIYFVTGEEKKSRIRHLAELFEINTLLNARVRTLSLGERMRCEVAAALIHRPKVLLADEPTIGLDIVAKNRLRSLIRQWQLEEKTTLVLTSHDLSDVEALCHRCILIDHGKLQFDGPLNRVKGELKDVRRITLTLSENNFVSLAPPEGISILESHDSYIHRYEVNTLRISMKEALGRLSQYYGDAIQDLQISEVSLEEVLELRFQSVKQKALYKVNMEIEGPK